MRILNVFLVMCILSGCVGHTRNVWRECEDSRRVIDSNEMGVVFINNTQIAVWCIDSRLHDSNGVTFRNAFIKYEVDEDISKYNGEIQSLKVDDEIQYDLKNTSLVGYGYVANLVIDGKVIKAKAIGCGRQDPGGLIKILRSDKIEFRRRFVVLKKNRKYETVAERVLVTPVAASLDAVDSAIAIASIPIWLPVIILLMNSDLKTIN